MADQPHDPTGYSPIANHQPVSLTGHQVPPERRDIIDSHVATLAATALAVSDDLALEADSGDVFCVMADDANARERDGGDPAVIRNAEQRR